MTMDAGEIDRSGAERRKQAAASELAEAERWVRQDPQDRRLIRRGLVTAIVLHLVVLFARLPAWGPEPKRIDAAPEQAMKVQFLKPPPPPPKVEPKPKPQTKRIPRPDPTPEEPEPEVAPEPPPVESLAPPAPVSEPVQTGPVRVSPGQGPGLVKRVEPKYPPIAQAARMEGTVILDAVIHQDGTVGEITVLRSANPLFDQSAMDALKQWRYTPGPYDVILTVTVNFTMR
jgi:periplasmic protein TonB